MRYRLVSKLPAETAHRRLRLEKELPAIPPERRLPGACRGGEHDFRPRQARFVRSRQPVPVSVAETQRRGARGHEGVERGYAYERDRCPSRGTNSRLEAPNG